MQMNQHFAHAHMRNAERNRIMMQQYTQQQNFQRQLQQQQLYQQQQQKQQVKQQPPPTAQYNQYSQVLTNDEAFLLNRSPFYETISRHCVMPIHQRQVIQFHFNLPPNLVSDIERSNLKKNTNYSKPSKPSPNASANDTQLHIRLFNLRSRAHEKWESVGWQLTINDKLVDIDELLNTKKNTKKKKGFAYVAALNISRHSAAVMKFQIVCKKHEFFGAAAIEIVHVIAPQTIVDRIMLRSDLAHNAHRLLSEQRNKNEEDDDFEHQCKICEKKENLSRCSRCKSIWYCSREHQAADWKQHHHICLPYQQLTQLQLKTSESADTDEIICGETRVSLKDPLSLCRIGKPVRGINCTHEQCMDLTTYITYSKNCKRWQCPVCMKELTSNELLIDYNMKKILQQTDDNIDIVRLYPNQKYKIITLEELEKEDEMRQNSLVKVNQKQKSTGKKRHRSQMNGNVESQLNGNSHTEHQQPNKRRKQTNDAGAATTDSSSSVPVGNTISTAIILD